MALDQEIEERSNRFVKAKIAKLLPGQTVSHGDREQVAGGGSGDDAMSGVADRSKIGGRFSLRVLSILTLVAIWQIASLFLSDTILPGPWPVVQTMFDNLNEAKSYVDIGATIYRVFGGILIATIGGLVLGLMMGLSRRAEYFFDPWVLVGLTIPAVVYGIVGILWFGLNSTAAIIAIAMTAIPAVALNIWQGVKAIDMSLVHMARAFRFPALAILRLVIIPQVLPFLLAAFRYALGIGWKTATIVEVIGLSTGVGYELNYWFGLFNMKQVFAWTPHLPRFCCCLNS